MLTLLVMVQFWYVVLFNILSSLCSLKIKGVKITTAAGEAKEVSIPATGKMYIKSAIADATVTSID